MDKILEAEINELITNRLAAFYCALTGTEKTRANAVEHSKPVDTSESTLAQLSPGSMPAELPSHGRGWHQKPLPYPIARAMEFCLKNCRIAQYNKESTDLVDLSRQKCKFPEDCSIDSVHRVDKQ